MSKRAFEKIKTGLDDARTYLDETADKRRYRDEMKTRLGTGRL